MDMGQRTVKEKVLIPPERATSSVTRIVKNRELENR